MLSPGACMYSVSLNDSNAVYELGHMSFDEHSSNDQEEQLHFFIRNFALDRRSFEKTMAIIVSEDFSLLPASYHIDGGQVHHLQFLRGDLQGKHSYSGSMGELVIEYALEPGVIQLLEKTFNGIRIRHSAEVNLGLFFRHRSLASCQAALILGENRCEIFFRNQEKLLFYNIFKWSNAEDVLYYLLFAMEQFGLNPAQTRLAFGGEFELDKEPVRTIKPYFFDFVPVLNTAPLQLNNNLNKLPGHYYFTLLNQHLCE